VVDLDIKGFFNHVDLEILMRLVRRVVMDRRVLGLICGWLKAGVLLNDELARMGLISLRRMISPSRLQLQLF
jgi:hypothetical protein